MACAPLICLQEPQQQQQQQQQEQQATHQKSDGSE
jgi:hypothetical protein